MTAAWQRIQQIRMEQERRAKRKKNVLPRMLIFSGPGANCLVGPSRAFVRTFGAAVPPKGAKKYDNRTVSERPKALPSEVRHPPRADGRAWSKGTGYLTKAEFGEKMRKVNAGRFKVVVDAQREAVLAGIRASLSGLGETTTGAAYQSYLRRALPWPLKHVTMRRFADYVSLLARDGVIEAGLGNLGRLGRTRVIRLPATREVSEA